MRNNKYITKEKKRAFNTKNPVAQAKIKCDICKIRNARSFFAAVGYCSKCLEEKK